MNKFEQVRYLPEWSQKAQIILSEAIQFRKVTMRISTVHVRSRNFSWKRRGFRLRRPHGGDEHW